MATKNVQLKDGSSNLLMPKTKAEIVDVAKNATTITLDARLKEMKFVAELDISGGTKTNGYINANGKTWVTSTTAYGRIIDISAYRGMSLIYNRKPSTTGRYALLRTYVNTNSANIDYASNAFLRTYNDNDAHIEKIPYDCTYLFCMVYSNSTDITPTVSVYDDSDSYNAGIAVGKIIGNFEEKIIKTIYPRQLQPANGYVGTSGTYTLSATNRGVFIDVVAYRGKKINWISPSRGTDWDTRWAFTKTAPTTSQSSSILCNNTIYHSSTGIFSAVIPNDANYLYFYLLSGGSLIAPYRLDFVETDIVSANNESIAEQNNAILSDEEDMNFGNTKVARVFSHYFPNIVSDDDLAGLDNATVTSSGITLPVGVSTPICHKKCFVFDDEQITLDVTVSTSDKILFYSSNSNAGVVNNSDVESYIQFDFINGTVGIYKAGTTDTSTGEGTVLRSASFTTAAGDYRISIGRRRRYIYASVYRLSDRMYTEVESLEYVQGSVNVNVAMRPSGWMYRYPSFCTLAGAPIYKQFSGYTKTNLYMLFQGDSYTEGYAGFYPQGWAYRAAKYFKNSRTCGISGCKLADIIAQYHDCIKGKVKTEIMVITIGLNDRGDMTTDAKVAEWAATFKTYLDELVADGITPIVNRLWTEGSSNQSTATLGQKMNNYIRSFGYDGAEFKKVNGYPDNEAYYTQSHLSPNGNTLSYEIFINELSSYRQV